MAFLLGSWLQVGSQANPSESPIHTPAGNYPPVSPDLDVLAAQTIDSKPDNRLAVTAKPVEEPSPSLPPPPVVKLSPEQQDVLDQVKEGM